MRTDLHKLLYTMKTLHTVIEPTEYPEFWNEEWLRHAMHELNTRNMSPEDRAAFARVIAINAEAVNAERRRVERLLQGGKLSIEEIADALDMDVAYVQRVQEDKAKWDELQRSRQ